MLHFRVTLDDNKRDVMMPRRCTQLYLFNNDSVDVCIEGSEQHAGRHNGGEVEEQQVVVVHDLDEVAAGHVGAGVPAEQRQKPHARARHPAHRDYT